MVSPVSLGLEVFDQSNHQTVGIIITLLSTALLLDLSREFLNKCASFSNVFVGVRCHYVLGQVKDIVALKLKVT